jgi:hypothetical protein
MPYKATFPKTCPYCGIAFQAYDPRLVYCSKECSDDNLRVTRRGPGNPHWKEVVTDPVSARQKARSLYDRRPCEECGSEKSEIHHRDGDPFNNHEANIVFLCRRHHMITDGRMERWLERNASRSKAS